MNFNSILSAGMKCPYCGKLINTSLDKANRTNTTAYCYFCDNTVALPEHLVTHPEKPVIRYLAYFNDFHYEGYGSYVATKKIFKKCDPANLTVLTTMYDQLAWHSTLAGVKDLASRNNTSPHKDTHHNHQFMAQAYSVKLKAKEVVSIEGAPVMCATPEENRAKAKEKRGNK